MSNVIRSLDLDDSARRDIYNVTMVLDKHNEVDEDDGGEGTAEALVSLLIAYWTGGSDQELHRWMMSLRVEDVEAAECLHRLTALDPKLYPNLHESVQILIEDYPYAFQYWVDGIYLFERPSLIFLIIETYQGNGVRHPKMGIPEQLVIRYD